MINVVKKGTAKIKTTSGIEIEKGLVLTMPDSYQVFVFDGKVCQPIDTVTHIINYLDDDKSLEDKFDELTLAGSFDLLGSYHSHI